MEQIKFTSIKEFVNWLIDNEGRVLADRYGRQWKYENGFKFKDIHIQNNAYENGLKCEHLFGTFIYELT